MVRGVERGGRRENASVCVCVCGWVGGGGGGGAGGIFYIVQENFKHPTL